MTFKDHFSRLAAGYASFRPHYPAALFDYLAQSCSRHEFAWDCACGSGQATLDLAQRFDTVLATDASAAQLAAAPAHANVRYRVARADESGLERASVDIVTVAQALHWFDLASFYAEVERVLRSAGVLAVWTYGVPHVAGKRVDQLMQAYYWDTLKTYWPAERRLVESGYRTLPFVFAELDPPSFEMHEDWSLAELMGYVRSWSATGRYVEVNAVDPAVALEESLAPIWGEPDERRRISWPLSLRVGVKP
ncbi:MAG TPA: class I SAM-dependent methyltransferase [Steroidobacteraceae bacterium]|jgi:SAM-dependent methyltransferase